MSSINSILKEKDMDIDFSALEQLLTNIGWLEGVIYVVIISRLTRNVKYYLRIFEISFASFLSSSNTGTALDLCIVAIPISFLSPEYTFLSSLVF